MTVMNPARRSVNNDKIAYRAQKSQRTFFTHVIIILSFRNVLRIYIRPLIYHHEVTMKRVIYELRLIRLLK